MKSIPLCSVRRPKKNEDDLNKYIKKMKMTSKKNEDDLKK